MRRLVVMLAMLMLGLMFTAAWADTLRPGEGVTVRPAIATWESARPKEMALRLLLEELGYTVAPARSLANPIFYQAVTDGDIDYWPSGWFPMHRTQVPANFDDHVTLAGVLLPAGGLEGYLVDRRTAEALDIRSLEDFKREEVRAAFDVTGDGRAELVACPPGWGCEIVIEHHLDAYELRDYVNPIKADYTASFADALARYQAGESVLVYTWTPNFTVFQLVPGEDVVWIEVPFSALPGETAEFEDATVAEGVEGCVVDPCNLGFPANDIAIVANRAFLEANPAIAALFAAVELDLVAVSEMTARISAGEDSDAELRAMVEAWFEANRETVDGWLAAARQAAQQ